MQMHITTKGVKFKQDIHPHESAVQGVIDVNTSEVKVAHSGATLRSVATLLCELGREEKYETDFEQAENRHLLTFAFLKERSYYKLQ